MVLGEIFEDGEAVPHDAVLGLESRHLARRRQAQDLGLAVRLAQPDALFAEADAAGLERDPGT
jgi:hypothetical protein